MGSFKDKNRPVVSAKDLRFGIVVSRFNSQVTESLLGGARRVLEEAGAASIVVSSVPGAFEIPLALQTMAQSKKYDALVALGAVIRGETPHFDFVCTEAARGIMNVMLQEKIPIGFGLLTTNNEREALDRAGGPCGNKGEEAALVAIEMVREVKRNG